MTKGQQPVEEKFDAKAWRARLDALGAASFLPEGRPEQPPLSDDDPSFD